MPVANFTPEFLELFRQGAQKPIELKGLTKPAAVSLRSRLNKMRVAMRKEQHPLLPSAERCMVSIIPSPNRGDLPDDQDFVVIVRPPDLDYMPALREAGIIVEDKDSLDPAPETAPPPSPESDTAAAVLAYLNNPKGT